MSIYEKKKMENFVQAKWSVITQEQSLRNLQELICPLDIKAESYSVLKQRTVLLHDMLLTVDTIQVSMYKTDSRSRVIIAPCKIKQEAYHLRSHLECWDNVAVCG